MIDNLPPPTDDEPGILWINTSLEEKQSLVALLKEIYDPEIPQSVYDIGLIYRIEKKEDLFFIDMTLTSPTCPEADILPEKIYQKLKTKFDAVEVKLVWQPLWSVERIPLTIQLELGIF